MKVLRELRLLSGASDGFDRASYPSFWKVLIVDDEKAVHDLTQFVLKDFNFEERPLKLLNAYSFMDAKKLLQEHPDIAVVFLDVVMEEENSGLKLVSFIREQLKNHRVRILLRTGQPGLAPEDEIIKNYDIDGYHNKTDLSTQRLYSALSGALRAYRDLELLYEKEQKFQLVLEGSRLAWWEFDFSKKYFFVNKRFCQILGYENQDEFPVDLWDNSIHPDDLKEDKEKREAHNRRGEPLYVSEFRFKRKDNKWIWVLFRGQVSLRAENKEPLKAYGTLEDITEKKKAELRLKESLENQSFVTDFLQLVNSSDLTNASQGDFLEKLRGFTKMDAVLIYELENLKSTILNESGFAFAGEKKQYSFPDKIDLSLFSDKQLDFLYKINFVNSLKLLPEFLKGCFLDNNLHFMVNLPLKIRDDFFGIIVFIKQKKSQKSLHKRVIKRVLLPVVQSLSNFYKKRWDLKKIQEIEQEKRIREQMLLRSERLAAFASLTSSVGHEINQPLQSIKLISNGTLFLAKNEKTRPSYEQLLKDIEKIYNRVLWAEEVVKNMKMILKMPEKLETSYININEIIEKIQPDIKVKLDEFKVELIFNLEKDLKPILFSEILFHQIMINLVSNACKAFSSSDKKERKFLIETKNSNKGILVKVSDNGLGVKDSIKEKIFDPFFSTFSSKESSGMGLFVVYHILKAFNADILVEKSKWDGACFILDFKESKNNNENSFSR